MANKSLVMLVLPVIGLGAGVALGAVRSNDEGLTRREAVIESVAYGTYGLYSGIILGIGSALYMTSNRDQTSEEERR